MTPSAPSAQGDVMEPRKPVPKKVLRDMPPPMVPRRPAGPPGPYVAARPAIQTVGHVVLDGCEGVLAASARSGPAVGAGNVATSTTQFTLEKEVERPGPTMLLALAAVSIALVCRTG